MIKILFYYLTPPIILKLIIFIRKYFANQDYQKLFDGDDALFKEYILNANTFAEYGCGASTIWVFKNTNSTILSVDSSAIWIDKVNKSCGNSNKIKLHYANIGRVKDWGVPVNYEKFSNFNEYTDWIWEQNISPDIVLIDGRFRVCCFLTSLLYAKEGVLIFFDDYTNREEYHIVERFIKPIRICGRQSLFCVPNKDELNLDEIKIFIHNFRFVYN